MPTDIQQKLLEAFQIEYVEHLEGIRTCLAQLEEQPGTCAQAQLEEMFRRAHSLKGAARIMGFSSVESGAHKLETLFASLREGTIENVREVSSVIHLALDAIEDAAATPETENTGFDVLQSLDAIVQEHVDAGVETKSEAPASTVSTTEKPAAYAPPPETVRLRAESLDRILQSTGHLLAENLHQDTISRELAELGARITSVQREWRSVKKISGRARLGMSQSPELTRVSQFLDLVDRELNTIARTARQTRSRQQRSFWSLRTLVEQLHTDVRCVRMVPVESEFHGLRKMMRDLARDQSKVIEFRVSGFDVQADRLVLQALKDPLMHMLRNAVTHGIETPDERRAKGKPPAGTVSLEVNVVGNRLSIVIEDDGHGVDFDRLAEVAVRRGLIATTEVDQSSPRELMALLFRPGFTTSSVVTELSGRGMGLSSVYETVSRLQGEVEIDSRAGESTTFHLVVPLAVSTHRVLLVEAKGQTFAVPLFGVESVHRMTAQAIETIEGRPMISVDGRLLPLATMPQMLGVSGGSLKPGADRLPTMILRSGTKRVAVVVDSVVTERDALIKSLGPPIDKMRRFLGGVLLEDGGVALVLNPIEVVDRFQPKAQSWKLDDHAAHQVKPARKILVVDDSFTTRTLETNVLTAHGFTVRVAVDGLDALEKLAAEKIDLVITDVQMPRLDGLGLLEKIKQDARLTSIPVIVVSSMDRREDKERGLDLGASAYIVKRKFDHLELLQTIEQIL